MDRAEVSPPRGRSLHRRERPSAHFQPIGNLQTSPPRVARTRSRSQSTDGRSLRSRSQTPGPRRMSMTDRKRGHQSPLPAMKDFQDMLPKRKKTAERQPDKGGGGDQAPRSASAVPFFLDGSNDDEGNERTKRLGRARSSSVSGANTDRDSSPESITSEHRYPKQRLKKLKRQQRLEMFQMAKLGPLSTAGAATESREPCTRDRYCWSCHRDGKQMIRCTACPRVFHLRCTKLTALPADDDGWVCQICRSISDMERSDTRAGRIPLEQLCYLFTYTIQSMKECEGSEPFWKAVDTTVHEFYRHYVAYPMDLSLLEENVRRKSYGSTEAFEADAKWILHNCTVFNAPQHDLTGVAKKLMRVCAAAMNAIDSCPDCYLRSFKEPDDYFTELCPTPHLPVWAKLKGFPHWPAKVMRMRGEEIEVRFFGDHDRSYIPVKDCMLYSKNSPTINSYKKSFDKLKEAVEEMKDYIAKLEFEFGKFCYAEVRTPFDPNKLMEQLIACIPNYKLGPRIINVVDDDSPPRNPTPPPRRPTPPPRRPTPPPPASAPRTVAVVGAASYVPVVTRDVRVPALMNMDDIAAVMDVNNTRGRGGAVPPLPAASHSTSPLPATSTSAPSSPEPHTLSVSAWEEFHSVNGINIINVMTIEKSDFDRADDEDEEDGCYGRSDGESPPAPAPKIKVVDPSVLMKPSRNDVDDSGPRKGGPEGDSSRFPLRGVGIPAGGIASDRADGEARKQIAEHAYSRVSADIVDCTQSSTEVDDTSDDNSRLSGVSTGDEATAGDATSRPFQAVGSPGAIDFRARAGAKKPIASAGTKPSAGIKPRVSTKPSASSTEVDDNSRLSGVSTGDEATAGDATSRPFQAVGSPGAIDFRARAGANKPIASAGTKPSAGIKPRVSTKPSASLLRPIAREDRFSIAPDPHAVDPLACDKPPDDVVLIDDHPMVDLTCDRTAVQPSLPAAIRDSNQVVVIPLAKDKTKDGQNEVVVIPLAKDKTKEGQSEVVVIPLAKDKTKDGQNEVVVISLAKDKAMESQNEAVVIPGAKNDQQQQPLKTFTVNKLTMGGRSEGAIAAVSGANCKEAGGDRTETYLDPKTGEWRSIFLPEEARVGRDPGSVTISVANDGGGAKRSFSGDDTRELGPTVNLSKGISLSVIKGRRPADVTLANLLAAPTQNSPSPAPSSPSSPRQTARKTFSRPAKVGVRRDSSGSEKVPVVVIPVSAGSSNTNSGMSQHTAGSSLPLGMLHAQVYGARVGAGGQQTRPRVPGPHGYQPDAHVPSDTWSASIQQQILQVISNAIQERAANDPSAALAAMQMELNKQAYLHLQEIKELKHHFNLTYAESQACFSSALEQSRQALTREHQRAQEDSRRQHEQRCRELERTIQVVKKKQWCTVCGEEAQLYCCWNTSYCDYLCQVEHWKVHMEVCRQKEQNNGDPEPQEVGPPNNNNNNTSINLKPSTLYQGTTMVNKSRQLSSPIRTPTPPLRPINQFAHQRTIKEGESPLIRVGISSPPHGPQSTAPRYTMTTSRAPAPVRMMTSAAGPSRPPPYPIIVPRPPQVSSSVNTSATSTTCSSASGPVTTTFYKLANPSKPVATGQRFISIGSQKYVVLDSNGGDKNVIVVAKPAQQGAAVNGGGTCAVSTAATPPQGDTSRVVVATKTAHQRPISRPGGVYVVSAPSTLSQEVRGGENKRAGIAVVGTTSARRDGGSKDASKHFGDGKSEDSSKRVGDGNGEDSSKHVWNGGSEDASKRVCDGNSEDASKRVGDGNSKDASECVGDGESKDASKRVRDGNSEDASKRFRGGESEEASKHVGDGNGKDASKWTSWNVSTDPLSPTPSRSTEKEPAVFVLEPTQLFGGYESRASPLQRPPYLSTLDLEPA